MDGGSVMFLVFICDWCIGEMIDLNDFVLLMFGLYNVFNVMVVIVVVF